MRGKGKKKRPTGGGEPYFVAVPDGADACNGLAAFFVCFSDEKVNGAGAEIQAVEKNRECDSWRDKTKPECFHRAPYAATEGSKASPPGRASGSGPISISR